VTTAPGSPPDARESTSPHPAASAVADLPTRLEHWARHHLHAGARIDGLAPMPGNAGLSFGFDVVAPDGTLLSSLVVRFAPPGVTRRGNTDVLRQVPLLEVLTHGGIPVAPVVWSTDDPAWFGTDALFQERLTAGPLHMTDPAGGVRPPQGRTGPYLQRAMHALAQAHALDWRTLLSSWEEPQPVAEQVAFWRRLLAKMPHADWRELGETLADQLLATDPGDHRIGVFHGDYHTNNVLFDQEDGHVAAIIDWEISGIGPVGVDVGWISMMTDPACWTAERVAQMQVIAEPAQIRSWYEEATGEVLTHFDWYRAFACFRYGVIAGFNLRLSLTGRRPDAQNEVMGRSVPVLFEQALTLTRP
jgi:aminoglycoside phosphotransferase (APT) family kinase protein